MRNIEVAVIIIDYFSAERTRQYIADFRESVNGCNARFIVVDHSCSAQNFALLKEGLNKTEHIPLEGVRSVYGEKDGWLLVIEADKNRGFAAGNNLGFRMARSLFEFQYVLFSNNDIRFCESIDFYKLIEPFRMNQDIAVVGPRIIGLDGCAQSPYRYVGIVERWWIRQLLWPFDKLIPFLGHVTEKTSDIIQNCENGEVYRVMGAFMVCDTERFCEVSGFDENTFLYAEELILSERMKKIGCSTYFNKNITVVHEGSFTTRRDGRIKKSKRKFESELYYYRNYLRVNKIIIRLTKLIFGQCILKEKIIYGIINWVRGDVRAQ